MIQANSLLLNFQMKSPCYLVTLSLESSDFQTFLKQYVILVPFGALIRVCNYQRLSPWSKSYSSSPDPLTVFCLNIDHGLSTSLKNSAGILSTPLVYYQLLRLLRVRCNLIFLNEGQVVYLHLGADCSPEMHCHHNSLGCMVLSNIPSIC